MVRQGQDCQVASTLRRLLAARLQGELDLGDNQGKWGLGMHAWWGSSLRAPALNGRSAGTDRWRDLSYRRSGDGERWVAAVDQWRSIRLEQPR